MASKFAYEVFGDDLCKKSNLMKLAVVIANLFPGEFTVSELVPEKAASGPLYNATRYRKKLEKESGTNLEELPAESRNEEGGCHETAVEEDTPTTLVLEMVL